MVIASGRREVRKSTSCTEAVSTLGKRLTSDGDGERKSGKLEGNHFDPEQGVVRLERLVAAGGESWGRGRQARESETSRRATRHGARLLLGLFSSLFGFSSHGAKPIQGHPISSLLPYFAQRRQVPDVAYAHARIGLAASAHVSVLILHHVFCSLDCWLLVV